MNIEELRSCIESAISSCQDIIINHPNVVLSESDFEKLICKRISEKIGEDSSHMPTSEDFSVHTQISHYFKKNGKYRIDERVDILVLKEDKLREFDCHKNNKYTDESVALELKYLRIGDSVSLIKNDIKKWEQLKEDSSLYIVVLVQANDDKKYMRKKGKIIKLIDTTYPERENGKNRLAYRILKK